MYSKTLSCTCRRLRSNQSFYGHRHQYLLHTNHSHSIFSSPSHKHHHYDGYLLNSARLFATNKPSDTNQKHDDSYLNLDDTDEADDENNDVSSRKWKSTHPRRQNIDPDMRSSSHSTTVPTKSKWDTIKSVFNKPFNRFKSKKSKSESTESIKKEKKMSRPGKKSLPSPSEGIMTFIPEHKAKILHILQEECNIFPDEVFPLFPDNKTEEILAEAEDWTGEGIKFVDDERTKQQLIAGQFEVSDDEADSDDEEYEEDEQQYIEDGDEDQKQLLLEQDGNDDESIQTVEDGDSSLIVSGKTPLAKIEMSQMTVSELMEDKPRTTAYKLRQQKVSGVMVDERSKFREMNFMNPYKYRRIMTPQQVKELYDGQNNDLVVDDDEDLNGAKNRESHPIWRTEPDNVYEIIQCLRDLGFKSSQNSTVWPYTEFLKGEESENQNENETDDDMVASSEEKKEIVPVKDDGSGGGLNPLPDSFNDFYLLFARFPEILSMEISDIRRKLHVLEQFQIDDIRILLLKDPRILRRPSHHIRWLLEVFDDYFVDDFAQIIELCPYFLASTSKKEMLSRLVFIHENILEVHKKFNEEIDSKMWYKNIQNPQKHLDKNCKFLIKNGKTIQINEKIESEMVNGKVYLDDNDKERLSEFVIKHPDFIGNANVHRMNEMMNLLKRLGIKNKKLSDLLYEYPQILTVSPDSFHECVHEIKRNGIRDYRQYIVDNIHDVLTYAAPCDPIVISDDDRIDLQTEEPQQAQVQM